LTLHFLIIGYLFTSADEMNVTGADGLLLSLNKDKKNFIKTHQKAVNLGKSKALSELQSAFGGAVDIKDKKQVAQAGVVLKLTSKNGVYSRVGCYCGC